jgi:hypothetical protein
MRYSRQSDTMLLFPLLPIFLVGMFPVLMMALLGAAGLGLVGILLISAGLTDALDANNDFNQHIVVEGYARNTQRAIYASDLRSSIRSAKGVVVAGIVLIVASIGGLVLL